MNTTRIHEIVIYCKGLGKRLLRREDIFLALLIIVVGFGGFGLGRLSALEAGEEAVHIERSSENATSIVPLGSEEGALVASVNGTKYHFPWCPSAQRIQEANKIWFKGEEEARKAGYEPAANCKGLE